MKKLHKLTAWVLVWALILGLMGVLPVQETVYASFPAPGATVTATGTVGVGGAPWELFSDGTVVVGSGSVGTLSQGKSPWSSHWSSIERIIFTGSIDAGTSLAGLFMDLYNLVAIEGLHFFDTSNVTNMSSTFLGTGGLTSLDLSSWNTSNVLYMSHMFSYTSGLTSLNLSGWDTSNVIDMRMMFSGARGLTSLDVSGWDTGNVTDMSFMFHEASGLTSLDVSGWNTSNVTNMSWMFFDASGLTSLDLSGWNTSNVINMSIMFASASGLTSLNVSGWNTGNVTNMASMFSATSGLTSLDLSGWDTSSVTYMDQMFNESGVTSLNISSWDTSNVTNMMRMFLGASGLTSLDVSGWNTSNVTNMNQVFERASGLTSLDLSGWDTSNLTDMSRMFFNASGLTSLDVSGWNTSNVTNMSSMFSGASSLTSLDASSWNTSNVTNVSGMFWGASGLTSLDASSWDTSNVTNMSDMFRGASSLTSLDVSGWNTSNVTNMSSMFWGASGLTSLDVSLWDTSNVTDMSGIFSGASGLTSLDVSTWNISNVTNMSGMFWDASGLTSLDVSLWDTSNVTNMSGIFSGASGLTSLDISHWDTSNVTDMGGMFDGASGLTSLDLSSWDASNVTDMGGMFAGASGLTSLDLSSWDTSNVTVMGGMFDGASGLTSLDVSSWNTSNVMYMGDMFRNATGLISLDLSSWDTRNVTDMFRMFMGASGLTSLDLSSWNTSNVTNMSTMFWDASGLTSLDVSSWDTSSATNMGNMFNGASGLTSLDFSGWNTSNVTNMTQMFHRMNSLNSLTFGEHFQFWGGASALHLPHPSPPSLYTGNWVNVGTGTLTSPQGSHVFTSAELRDFYTTPQFADTWVWQRTSDALTFPVTITGSQLPAGTASGQSGQGQYAAGDTVAIRAGTRAGHNFYGWTVTAGDVTLADASLPETTFTMPASPVAITAHWIDAGASTGVIATGTVGTGGAPWRLYENGTVVVENEDFGVFTSSPWAAHSNAVIKIIFNGPNPIDAGTSLRNLFRDLSNLTAIEGLHFINTGNVTSMDSMFAGASGLTNLNVSGWNTSNVESMRNMFSRANGLTSLDLSGWDTSNVTNMTGMFANASNLTNLNLSGWDTGSVMVMEEMLNNTVNLRQIALSNRFHFAEPANLPNIPSTAQYTGKWANVGTGTAANPLGAHAFTSAQLEAFYATPAVADTWVWQTTSPGAFSVTINGSQLPAGTASGQSGQGEYAAGASVTIRAGTRTGYTFDGWTVTSGGVTLANAALPQTTFTMPANAVTVTANWKQDADPTLYIVTVNGSTLSADAGGSGTGQYAPGTTVTIRAGSRIGFTFAGWTVDWGGISLNRFDSTTTTFTMPAGNVHITAHWNAMPGVPDIPGLPDWWWLLYPQVLFPLVPAVPSDNQQPTDPNIPPDNIPPLQQEQQPQQPQQPAFELPSFRHGQSLPTLNMIEGVFDKATAVEAVQGVLQRNQMQVLPIGYVESFAEAAIMQAAAMNANAVTSDGFIVVNQANVMVLQQAAHDTRSAILEAMHNAGHVLDRPLQASVAFIAADAEDVRVRVESSAMLTDVDRVWITTPFYAVALNSSFIENNVDNSLIITVTSDVHEFRSFIPPPEIFPDTPWQVPAPAERPAPTPRPEGFPDLLPPDDPFFATPPDWIFGPTDGLEDFFAVLGTGISTQTHRTYTVSFSYPVTESVRITVPPESGDPAFQVLRGTDGSNIGGRYNAATGNLEARVSQNGTFVVMENRVDFSDIRDRSFEMQTAIRQLASQGVMQGATHTEFRPDDPMTRAQVAATVVRMLSIYDPNATGTFTDVLPADWFYAAVNTANRQGLMSGISPTTFAPNQSMVREQLITLSGRVLHNEMGYAFPTQPEVFLRDFIDWEDVSSWNRSSVALAARENLPMLRADGMLLPQENITRGEAAVILSRLYQRLW